MNIPGVVIIVLMVALALYISESLGRRSQRTALVARKALHIAGVGGLAIAPVFFSNPVLLTFIAGFFLIVLFVAVKRRWLVADLYSRRSWGIALFPLAFMVLWIWYGPSAAWMVIYPMLVLALSDAAAAISGGLCARQFYNVSGDSKSYLGSFTFAITTFLVLVCLPPLLSFIHPLFKLPILVTGHPGSKFLVFAIISVFAAMVEGSTSGGWDNVTVPISVAWLLTVLPGLSSLSLVWVLPVFFMLSGLGVIAFQKGLLDFGGSILAVITGVIIWISGGWASLTLMFLFFATGSLWGRLPNHSPPQLSDAKKGKPRDYIQVVSNGGVAALCMVWYGIDPSPEVLTLFATSVAISTADTWSSEVGMWARGRVVDILGFRPLPAGISGGISWQGTLMGLAGSLFIGVTSYLFWEEKWIVWVVAGGFLGMLTDSFLGSLFQARYLVTIKGQKTVSDEVVDTFYQLEKGFSWMTNDLVNLLSNLIITLLGGILVYFWG